MPQVDIATFFDIVYWTFFIYVLGFLILTESTLPHFLAQVKVRSKRAAYAYAAAMHPVCLLSSAKLPPFSGESGVELMKQIADLHHDLAFFFIVITLFVS